MHRHVIYAQCRPWDEVLECVAHREGLEGAIRAWSQAWRWERVQREVMEKESPDV